MQATGLLGLWVLAWAGAVQAQDAARDWAPPDCAQVEAGSLEAELLDCDAAAGGAPPVAELEDWPQPHPEEVTEEAIDPAPLPEAASEQVVVIEETAPEAGPVLAAEEAPAPEPVLEPVVVIEEDAAPVPESDAAIEDLPAEDRPETLPIENPPEPVEVERPETSGPAEPAVREARENGRKRDGGGLRIPKGHRPPPGSCRLWFPDRPPGHQPPPSSCDVDVPAGAVLIRG